MKYTGNHNSVNVEYFSSTLFNAGTMNNQARRRIPVFQGHYLFQSSRHLENHDPIAFDNFEHFYDANTQIATVRCFWQHIVSSTVGANLVNIKVGYMEFRGGRDVATSEVVMDRHRDGTPVTIGYLAGLGMNNVNNNADYFLYLSFKYVMGNVVNEPHCICSF